MEDVVRESRTRVTEGSNILGVEDIMGVLLAPFESGRDILLTLARPVNSVELSEHEFDNTRMPKREHTSGRRHCTPESYRRWIAWLRKT